MAYRVKIYGAGSVGNHFSYAARCLGWDVTVCDVSEAALERMRKEIYPRRYGNWDEAIRLCTMTAEPRGEFDIIVVGTPPDHHLDLALKAAEENPRAVLIEKPACPPSLELAETVYETARASRAEFFVGYDHVVGGATGRAEELLRQGAIGRVETIDVEFREHWGGIFAAHPWLTGPEDSYLGFWSRGGGASGEHSHAANLWQHFAHLVGGGRVREVCALLQYVSHGRAVYDSLCFMHLRTETGFSGRVVQDVVTTPPSKRARIQGSEGTMEWINGYSPEGDAVIVRRPGSHDDVHLIPKKRPDDFIEELRALERAIVTTDGLSAICLERGLDTMLVIAAAHRSEREKCRMQIDYTRGYSLAAISPCGAGGED